MVFDEGYFSDNCVTTGTIKVDREFAYLSGAGSYTADKHFDDNFALCIVRRNFSIGQQRRQ